MIRALLAAALVVLAALLVAVSVDLGRWEHSGHRRPHTLLGNAAEVLLGTTDDVRLRDAVDAFTAAENTPFGYDNGMHQEVVRAQAQTKLASIASSLPQREAAQVDDLLGVLAWGGTTAPLGVLDPADRAVNAFTLAARLDPSDTAATFNLELALRALQSKRVRVGAGHSGSTHGIGNGGAGAGGAGAGY